MPGPNLNASQLRAALTEHTEWLIKQRDHYTKQHTEGGLDISREAANTVHHILWMLAARTRDEFGDRETPGFPIPLPPIVVPDPARAEQLQAAVFPPTQHGTGCTCCGAGVQQWR